MRMRPSPVQARVLQSALLAALLLAAFDLVWVYAGALSRARELTLLGDTTVLLGAYGTGLWALFVVASTLALLQLLVGALYGLLARRFPPYQGIRGLSVATAVVVAPALYGVAVYLGRGGWARQHLAAWPARTALTLVACLGVAGLVAASLRLRVRGLQRHPRLYRVGFVALALALVVVDHRVLPRLYLLLHGLLLLGAALCVQQLAWDWTKQPFRRDGLLLCALALLWMLALPALAPWSSRPLSNFYVAEFAPFAGKALRAIGELRSRSRVAPRPEPADPAQSRKPPAFDLIDGRDLLIVSVDGLSPFRSSLPIRGRVTARETTPFLAERAARGVHFVRHYTAYPNTEISLLTLLSGVPHDARRRPLHGGVADAALTRHFAARGYRTYCDIPYAEELFRVLRTPERCDALVTYSEAHWNADGLLRYVADSDAPVFALVHFVSTHVPYQRFADHGFGDGAEDHYDEALSGTDAVLRRLYTELRQLRPEARIVFTSDHGHAFGWHGVTGHGSSLYEDQLRIPLILDGFDLPSQTVQRVTSLTDLFGLLTGQPARRALAGQLGAGRVPATAGHAVIASFESQRAIVDERYKLVTDPAVGSEALFDLQRDLQERHNRVSQLPDEAVRLRAALSGP